MKKIIIFMLIVLGIYGIDMAIINYIGNLFSNSDIGLAFKIIAYVVTFVPCAIGTLILWAIADENL